jgi:hypothetical protein
MTQEQAIKELSDIINRTKSISPSVKKRLLDSVVTTIGQIDASTTAIPAGDQNRPFKNGVAEIRKGKKPGTIVVMTEQMSSQGDDFSRARVKNPVNKW